MFCIVLANLLSVDQSIEGTVTSFPNAIIWWWVAWYKLFLSKRNIVFTWTEDYPL